MGLLSKIWEGVKNVFKGILRVFQPILEPIAKFLNTGLGKAIMIGLTIFTLGSAMVAGYGAFSSSMAAGNGFISSFVEGGKVFLQTLTGIGGKEGAGQGAAATDPGAAVSNVGQAQQGADVAQLAVETGGAGPTIAEAGSEAVAQGALGSGTASTQAAVSGGQQMGSTIQGSGGMGGMPNLPVEAPIDPGLASRGIPGATTTGGSSTGAITAAPREGKWLSRAANMAKDFIGSETGKQLTGKLIEGVGDYYLQKDQQEFLDRNRRQWMQGTRDEGIRGIREASARLGNIQAPDARGIATAGQQTARQGGGRPYFARPYGAAAGG